MEWLKIILEKAEIKDNKLDVDSLIKEINKEFDKNYVSKDELKNVNEQLNTANKTILDLTSKCEILPLLKWEMDST